MTHNIDFIGIGYAKSGTSYLYEQLNAHPEFEMPEIKEIRYLNESWFMPKGSLMNRFFSPHFHYKQYRHVLKSRLKYWFKHPSHFLHDRWYRHYLLGSRSDAWYDGLFDAGKISGELTPAYVFMPEQEIESLSQRFPDLKIVIMLRHPVARTWSHVKMNLAKHKNRSTADLRPDEISQRLDEVLSVTPMYCQAIPLWKKHFDNIFIGFHEDLVTRPEGLISELLAFLGAKDRSLTELPIRDKINVGVSGEIPDWVEDKLTSHFKKEIEQLKTQFDLPYVKDWSKSN